MKFFSLAVALAFVSSAIALPLPLEASSGSLPSPAPSSPLLSSASSSPLLAVAASSAAIAPEPSSSPLEKRYTLVPNTDSLGILPATPASPDHLGKRDAVSSSIVSEVAASSSLLPPSSLLPSSSPIPDAHLEKRYTLFPATDSLLGKREESTSLAVSSSVAPATASASFVGRSERNVSFVA